jgi:hypothetical protein
MLLISRLVVGLLLLVLGRRLYWLFVAGIGFVTGLQLGPRLLPDQSELMIVAVALLLALVGALVAVVATKVALGIIGFVAGGGVAILLLGNLGMDGGTLALIIYVVAGIAGAVLLLVLFDWALIVLSSLAGSSLLVMSLTEMLALPSTVGGILIIVLAVIGIAIQANIAPRARASR